MRASKPFFDTNVLLYLLSGDAAQADRAEAVLARGGTISVQVLNEFAAVATRKLSLSYAEIREVLEPVRAVCAVVPLTLETHDLGLQIAERYGFSIDDALSVAAALLAGCATLYFGKPARRPDPRRAAGRPQPFRPAPERDRSPRSRLMNAETLQFEVGRGNVYADLGFPDAEEMLIKAQLTSKIGEILKARR